jgi:hypothetical protein
MPLPMLRHLLNRVSILAVFVSAICLHAHAQNCPGDGDCLEPNGTPGCVDPGCCESICAIDPFCCKDWDLNCASLADVTCAGLCGAQASGSCFSANGSPACNDRNCCESVCLSDPYCCNGMWDSNCALFAGFFCPVPGGDCGDSDAGDCFEANGTPACNDTDCCEVVCGIDPTCCDLNWDAICAAIASDACAGACVVGVAAGDRIESEACDGPSNDACGDGAAEVLAPNRAMHGTFQSASDRDVVSVDVSTIEQDGDGFVRLRLRAAAAAATVTVRETDCDGPLLLELDTVACIGTEAITCIPATSIVVIIEPTGEVPPCEEPGWRLTVDVADTCGTVCGNELECLSPHASPGCDDAACCDLVCAQDPVCCDWSWDSPCAVQAADLCGGDPPSNDACLDALDIGVGATPFRQLLSTISDPPGDCIDPARRGGDIWFRHVVTCDSLMRIGTCATADFNTLIEVFEGDCRDLIPVECVDDEEFCTFETGSVIVNGQCGDIHLIRVSGVDAATGNGELVIECFGGSCACVGDLDGNGWVDGADLGALFIAWGPCSGSCDADLDGDGEVSGSDLGLLFSAWGDC